MKDIYTKTGDKGTTSLKGGTRVPKDDIRIEANGMIDLLNSQLGLVRAASVDKTEKEILLSIQKELMIIMSHVATPEGIENTKILHCNELTKRIEEYIDGIPSPDGFVIPGENLLSSQIHIARSTARTVERRLWTLNREYPVKEEILVFFNRLSDCLFAMALKHSK
ncbi:MAG: cob(I)yrinic acid a,c-diamide adenosyltransferase [Bacteroidales bacterium]|nr:cob(I)yrinic acid a,c-diamide adenosyltransferase [Bacteroidales bacterium]